MFSATTTAQVQHNYRKNYPQRPKNRCLKCLKLTNWLLTGRKPSVLAVLVVWFCSPTPIIGYQPVFLMLQTLRAVPLVRYLAMRSCSKSNHYPPLRMRPSISAQFPWLKRPLSCLTFFEKMMRVPPEWAKLPPKQLQLPWLQARLLVASRVQKHFALRVFGCINGLAH